MNTNIFKPLFVLELLTLRHSCSINRGLLAGILLSTALGNLDIQLFLRSYEQRNLIEVREFIRAFLLKKAYAAL